VKKGLSTEAKVGFFVFLVLGFFIYMTFELSKYPEKKRGYAIYAYFENVAGVYEATPVHLEGLKVGVVESLEYKDGKILVKMRIREGVKIKRDAVATIKTKGVLGSAYIDITHGTPESGELKEGDFIEKTRVPVDMDYLIQKAYEIEEDIKGVTESLKKSLGGKEGEEKISALVDNLSGFFENVKNMTEGVDTDFKTLVSLLREDAQKLRDFIDRANATITENRENIREAVKKAKEFSEKLDKAIAQVEGILDDIESGKGTIGKLIKDEETAKKIEDTLTSLKEMTSATQKWQLFLKYRGEIWLDGDSSKHLFGIRLQPNEKKYYELDIESVPEWSSETKDLTGERTLSFSLYLAMKLWRFRFRGGIIESTGGIGVDIDLLKNYISFTMECYDFLRKTNPALRAYLDITPYKYFFITAGGDYLIDYRSRNRRFFAGIGVIFSDEDLKKILGLAATSAVAGSSF